MAQGVIYKSGILTHQTASAPKSSWTYSHNVKYIENQYQNSCNSYEDFQLRDFFLTRERVKRAKPVCVLIAVSFAYVFLFDVDINKIKPHTREKIFYKIHEAVLLMPDGIFSGRQIAAPAYLNYINFSSWSIILYIFLYKLFIAVISTSKSFSFLISLDKYFK